jgi:hypothetical protein
LHFLWQAGVASFAEADTTIAPMAERNTVMRNVAIHRCPACDKIKGRTDDLVAEMRNDPDVKVSVVDGAKGEFSVEVDGQQIDGKSGYALREASELAAEIRGAHAPAM